MKMWDPVPYTKELTKNLIHRCMGQEAYRCQDQLLGPTGDCKGVLAPLGLVWGRTCGTLTGNVTNIQENLCGSKLSQEVPHSTEQYMCVSICVYMYVCVYIYNINIYL